MRCSWHPSAPAPSWKTATQNAATSVISAHHRSYGHPELQRDAAERAAWLAEALVGLSETERQVLVLALAAALMEQIADS